MLGKILKLLGTEKSTAQAAIDTPPASPDPVHLLIADGNRAEASGNFVAACGHYRKAVGLAPDNATAHLNLGIGLDAIGNADEARQSFERALALDPADVYANYNLGRQLVVRKSLEEAEPLLVRAIEGNPNFVDARVMLSAVLESKGNFADAATELEKALQVQPDYFGALQNYADVLFKLQRPDDAVSALRRAFALQPNDFTVNYKLGTLLRELDRGREAKRHFQEALRSNPDSLESRVGLVNIHLEQNELDAAALQAEAVLRQRPDWVDLLFDYGLVLKRMNRNAEAESVFRRIIGLDKTYTRAYHMLGAVLTVQSRIKDALEVFTTGRQHCTDAFELESAEIFAMNSLEDISIDELFARHVDFGNRIEQHYAARFEDFANVRDPGRRLRIGFVSGDFQYHVVPLFLLPLLEERDHAAVEIYCYSTGDTDDAYTERLRRLADVWRPVARMTPEDVANMINGDGIDVLIDLAGHSGIPNLRVFAQRPAPVQATWVGYLNTTGLTRIHYRISDERCDPEGLTDRHHTEKLVRLPHSQWCYRPFEEVACEPEAACVKNGYVTFGSFNQTFKISSQVRALWGRILMQVPDSRFVVVGVVDDRAREGLLRDLENDGVDRARVTMAPYLPVKDYYRWYNRVDIALDTMPFSGGTTTCDSLWMGTPVVTMPGVRSWSRSAGSILTTLGLQDWIAESPEDYVRLAVQYARDPALIAGLRKSLRSRMLDSPLTDKRQFARDMENAYRRMWQSWCEQGEK